MSIDTSGGHPDMDYKEHQRTYNAFLQVTKWALMLLVLLLIVMALTLV